VLRPLSTWPPGPSPLVGGREKARPQTLAESFIRSIRRDRLRQRPKPKIVVPFCGLVCGIGPNLANKLRFQADCRRKDVRQRVRLPAGACKLHLLSPTALEDTRRRHPKYLTDR